MRAREWEKLADIIENEPLSANEIAFLLHFARKNKAFSSVEARMFFESRTEKTVNDKKMYQYAHKILKSLTEKGIIEKKDLVPGSSSARMYTICLNKKKSKEEKIEQLSF